MARRGRISFSRVGEFDTRKEWELFHRDEWWCEALQLYTTIPPDKWPAEWRKSTERK